MLKRYTAALAAALMLCSCGSAGSSKADPVNTVTSAPVSDTVTEAAAEPETETVTEAVSSEETETVTETELPEPEDPETYEELLATVDRSYEFETPNGEVTFGERLDAGFGNVTGDGRAFCVIPNGGGAGNVYFDCYYTVNGGGSWSESARIQMFTGKMQAFAVEDGRVVVINAAFALSDELPIAYILSLEEGEEGFSISCDEDKDYFKAFTGFNNGNRCDVSVRYDGGLNLMIAMKDSESGEAVYEALTALFPDTLEPDLGDPADRAALV